MRTVVTDDMVREIRRRSALGERDQRIADELGLSRGYVNQLVNYRRRANVEPAASGGEADDPSADREAKMRAVYRATYAKAVSDFLQNLDVAILQERCVNLVAAVFGVSIERATEILGDDLRVSELNIVIGD